MKLSFRRISYNVFFRLSPLLILVLFELSLRFLGVGDSYRLFQASKDKSCMWLNPLFYQRYMAAEQFPDLTLPQQCFAAEKDAKSKRVFLLADQSLFSLIPDAAKNKLLENFYGKDSTRWEIIQVAVPLGNSFSLQHLAREIRRYSPDAAIILTGNNEFYGLPRKNNWIKDADNYWGLRAYTALKKYRFFQILERFVYIKNDAVDSFPPRDPDNWAVSRGSSNYSEIQSIFRRNLQSISHKKSFPLLFVTVPINIKHIPFRSDFKDKELLDVEFVRECAILLHNSDRFMLERWIHELQVWEPETAIFYYCQALIQEDEKKIDAALENYKKAVEMDIFRVRNALLFNEDIREIANEKMLFCIDAEQAFWEKTDGGLNIRNYYSNGISLNEKGKQFFCELLREGLQSCLQP